MSDHFQQGGIVLNSKTIPILVGVVTLLGAMFTVVDKINSVEHRMRAYEISEIDRKEKDANLINEIKILNLKLTDLTIELREMRAVDNAKNAFMNKK